jgi:hypothetical protein
MARQNISAGSTGLSPMTPASPLHELAPGPLAKLTPAQRGKKLKRTTKQLPDHPALMTPAGVLGK